MKIAVYLVHQNEDNYFLRFGKGVSSITLNFHAAPCTLPAIGRTEN